MLSIATNALPWNGNNYSYIHKYDIHILFKVKFLKKEAK